MFAKYLQAKVRAAPLRPQEWANRIGPVALFGTDNNTPGASKAVLKHFKTVSHVCDRYTEVRLHSGTEPIELPPDVAMLLPTLLLGSMDHEPEVTPSAADWYLATSEAAAELYGKGYAVINIGGDGAASLPMLEAYKAAYPEDQVIFMHFSAHSTLSDPRGTARGVVDKQLAKVISCCNRNVSKEDRRIRKANQMHFFDGDAIYHRGIFLMRDLRNDFPVFLSIDVGVLDPSVAPAVREPISGGLSARDLLHLIRAIRAPRIAGVDIHGYSPELDVYRKDGLGITVPVLTKLLNESIHKTFTASSMTEAEGIEKFKEMKRDKVLNDDVFYDL
jgi:arginase family enzyme